MSHRQFIELALGYFHPPDVFSAFLGITIGTCCTFLLCAAVQYYSYWPVGFYVSGGMQAFWSAVWVLVVADHPRKHPCISKEELSYLINTIGTVFAIKVCALLS